MGVPLIEQVKIQAQVLVPLVRTLQAELGEDRANTLVRKALGSLYRQFGETWWRAQGASKFDEKLGKAFERFAAGDALDYEVFKQTPNTFELNVTGCRYAKFYKELGAPELGFLLTCSADFSFAEGFGSDVELTRTQTIMQGADHCDRGRDLGRHQGRHRCLEHPPKDQGRGRGCQAADKGGAGEACQPEREHSLAAEPISQSPPSDQKNCVGGGVRRHDELDLRRGRAQSCADRRQRQVGHVEIENGQEGARGQDCKSDSSRPAASLPLVFDHLGRKCPGPTMPMAEACSFICLGDLLPPASSDRLVLSHDPQDGHI